MSHRNWLLFGSLGLLGAAQTVGCSSEFRTCETTHTCAPGAAGGTAGTAGVGAAGSAHAGTGAGGKLGANKGGSAGVDAEGGEAGTADVGSGGQAGEGSLEMGLEIATPNLATGKTYVPFTGKISASGAAKYNWSILSGTLPAGLALQGSQAATVTITGTPTQAGQFPISLSVTDGVTTKSVDVTLGVTHPAVFLSDQNTSGVNELFVTEIGAAPAAVPVQLSASLPAGGGVSSYAWSPDGSKVIYLATQSPAGATELWVSALESPGIAQRVSAAGTTVSGMVWLKSGNVAAYTTTAGQAYAVDLSGSVVGESKLAVTSSSSMLGALYPSPNGKSFLVGEVNTVLQTAFAYVTWTTGAPKSVHLAGAMGTHGYSYNGQYVLTSSSGIGSWTDLTLESLTGTTLGHSFSAEWSPNAQTFLYGGGALDTSDVGLVRGTCGFGTLSLTALVPGGICKGVGVLPWSPDGRNGIFGCDKELRGISNIAVAAAGADFALLPNGFSANSFTDIQSVGWSPDSQWVVLRADRDVSNQYDLQLIRWSAPGTVYKPHANTTGPGVSTWAFSQNSQSVAFVGTVSPQANAGLYLARLSPTGPPTQAPLISAPANAVVQTDINWLTGSRVITYRATVSGGAQLFAVPIAADGTAGSPIPISGVSGSGVTSYQLAPTR